MKKSKLLFTCNVILFLFLMGNLLSAQNNRIFSKEYIADIIDKVNRYQLNNPWSLDDYNWIRGTYYTGVMACYQATGIEKYLIQCNTWGNSFNWGIPPIGYAEGSGANVLTCSQTWLESYMVKKDKYKILPLIEHLERKDLKTPAGMPARYYYEGGRKYVDALYVCAPALAMLGKVTGDPKYLAWMDSFFWDVYGTLYDDNEHLFYRDLRFRPESGYSAQSPVIPDSIDYADAREPYAYQKTKNGKKVLWARGNGWAFASVARILKYIPSDHGNYTRYMELFIEIAEQLKIRQQPDGFWYPNLDDPFDYGSKESSGTGFFTYGLAWGINNGILSKEDYLPVVAKAWEGLVSVVSEEGKVQWGQRVSFAPHKILMEDSHEYVAGMFLLAASEIYKLAEHTAISQNTWQVGFGRRIITPQNDVWLAGYGMKRAAESKIHDLWVKVMALKSPGGNQIVLVTTDHMGMSKTVYESLYSKVHQLHKINRSEFMLTFSHNHCGPCLTDDLVDYYPSDVAQRDEVKKYTDWMEVQVLDAVGEALSNWQPAHLFMGEGKCTFAMNRRENLEEDVPKMLAGGIPLKGVTDHYVPVMAVRSPQGNLLGVLFGYACHPTTLAFNSWCGDYPGFAQINIETNHSGASAMFFNACGADQNPPIRRNLELCADYGKMLSDAVENVLSNPMKPVSTGLKTSFSFVDLEYEEIVTREKLIPIADSEPSVQSRWAQRLLKLIDDGVVFPTSYPYPVQAWQIGKELLLIGMGGEAVVDYSLRFKREFGAGTWVCGYTNDMAAYIPSRRVWEEGGYEGGPHLDEYGRPAWRWTGDVEEKVAGTVHQVVNDLKNKKTKLLPGK